MMLHRNWRLSFRSSLLVSFVWLNTIALGWSQHVAIPISTLSRPGVVTIQQSGWLLQAYAAEKSQTWLEKLEKAQPGYRTRLHSYRAVYERIRNTAMENGGDLDVSHPSHDIATAMVGIYHQGWTVAMPEVVFVEELAGRTYAESGDIFVRLPLQTFVEIPSDLMLDFTDDAMASNRSEKVVILHTSRQQERFELPKKQMVSIGRLLSREPFSVSGTDPNPTRESDRYLANRKKEEGLVLLVERIDSKRGPIRIIVPEILGRVESGPKSVVHGAWLLDPYHSIPLLDGDRLLLTDWNTLPTLTGLSTIRQTNHRTPALQPPSTRAEAIGSKQRHCFLKKNSPDDVHR